MALETTSHRRINKFSHRSGRRKCPAKPHWCQMRQTVFGWTHAKFPFSVRSGRKLNITEPGILTVTGKAFFDNNHAPADQSNRRPNLPGYAVWEIHPVMKLTVQ
jgi:hypothetical protein